MARRTKRKSPRRKRRSRRRRQRGGFGPRAFGLNPFYTSPKVEEGDDLNKPVEEPVVVPEAPVPEAPVAEAPVASEASEEEGGVVGALTKVVGNIADATQKKVNDATQAGHAAVKKVQTDAAQVITKMDPTKKEEEKQADKLESVPGSEVVVGGRRRRRRRRKSTKKRKSRKSRKRRRKKKTKKRRKRRKAGTNFVIYHDSYGNPNAPQPGGYRR